MGVIFVLVLFCETVVESCTSCSAKLLERTSSCSMRWVPRLHSVTIIDTDTVVMSDDRRSAWSCRPVATGSISRRPWCSAIGETARQYIMIIRSVSSSRYDISILIEWDSFCESICPMECCEILYSEDSLGVVPWSLPDTVTSIHSSSRSWWGRTEICTPRPISCTCSRCKRLAIYISTHEPSKIASTSWIRTRDEEAHLRSRLCRKSRWSWCLCHWIYTRLSWSTRTSSQCNESCYT